MKYVTILILALAACGTESETEYYLSRHEGGSGGDVGAGGRLEPKCKTPQHGTLWPCTDSDDCTYEHPTLGKYLDLCVAPPGTTGEETSLVGQCGRGASNCVDNGCVFFIEDGLPVGVLCGGY